MNVFISYSSVDRDWAFDLMRLLEANGCDVWLDFFDIKPAEVLEGELTGNLARADLVCILLSPTSVASRWVGYEIELALVRQAHGLRVLPVILRPCTIPDALGKLVGIDVTAGLEQEAVRLRMLRAVLGTATIDDGVLLDAGKRLELADRAMRDAADRALPNVATEIARVRNEPIRELNLSVGLDTFPAEAPVVMELRLSLDPLWTQPMSWFFARYREGATWPSGFDFPEPSYVDYYKDRRPRLTCVFSWFDRVEIPTQEIDGTDLGGRPPTFSLNFDGARFQPGGPGPNLPQLFEVPALQNMVDKESQFELITHDPATRTARIVDLATTDLDVEVWARFVGKEPANVRLFRSRQTPYYRTLVRCNHLTQMSSAIEREALLGLYPGASAPTASSGRSESARLHEMLETDAPVEERDRRALARIAFGDALLARVRGDPLRMLKRFEKTARLLEPIVLQNYPTYSEGMLMYRACESLVSYFIEQNNFKRAAGFMNGVGLVAQRLVKLDAEEPDYRRLWAEALEISAIVHAANGDTAQATGELREAVETWRALQKKLPSSARELDARTAYARALDLAQAWGVADTLPFNVWAAELDPQQMIHHAVADRRVASALLTWLQPADPPKWPTVPFESPLLRYALRLPKRWKIDPELKSTGRETMHVFRGPWPSEWLIVSMMDKATPGGDIGNWVEAIIALTGFPVLEMIDGDAQPKLLDWRDEGKLEDYAQSHALDEARAYTGFAALPGADRHMARLYILVARRGTLAWKITLAIESACLPGTPEQMVAANDHVRAGAVLGTLRLG